MDVPRIVRLTLHDQAVFREMWSLREQSREGKEVFHM